MAENIWRGVVPDCRSKSVRIRSSYGLLWNARNDTAMVKGVLTYSRSLQKYLTEREKK